MTAADAPATFLQPAEWPTYTSVSAYKTGHVNSEAKSQELQEQMFPGHSTSPGVRVLCVGLALVRVKTL